MWTIIVRGDAPAFYRFDPDRLQLLLEAGEKRDVHVRLVPRRRDVQMQQDDAPELHAVPADSKGATVPGVTKTVKPSQHR